MRAELEINTERPLMTTFDDRGRERFILPRGRDDFVPTPLDPHNVVCEDSKTPYVIGSLDKVQALVDETQANGRHPEWFTDCVRESLMAALMKRCEQNNFALAIHRASFDPRTIDEDFEQRHERARAGVASVEELLSLASHPQGLGAVEVAKLSHPLDWHATKPMDEAISSALEAYEDTTFLGKSDNNRYKFQRAVMSPEGSVLAVVVSRKRNYAVTGNLLIVKRSSLVIRLDDELDEDQQAPEDLKVAMNDALAAARVIEGQTGGDADAYQEFLDDRVRAVAADTIEQALALQAGERPSWLTPTATSYYCKAVDRELPRYRFDHGDHVKPDREILTSAEEQASESVRGYLGSAAVGSRPYSLQP